MRQVIVVLVAVCALLVSDFHVAHARLFTKKQKIALIGGGIALVVLGAWARASNENDFTQIMKSWMGHHKSELILKWGPPTRISEDGKGGQVFVYEFDKRGQKIEKDSSVLVETSPGVTWDLGGTYRVRQTGYVATRMFWIDRDGILYHWQWEGL